MKKLIFFSIQIFLFSSISYSQLLDKNLTIGTENDQINFGLIQDIDVSKSGYIYVSDWYNQSIRVFSINGKLTDTIGREGKGPGEFAKINGSGLSDLGYLYVHDSNLKRVSIFNIGSSSNELTNMLNIHKLKNNTPYSSIASDIYVFNTEGDFLIKYNIPYSPGTGKMDRSQKLVLFNSKGDILAQPLLTIKENQYLVREEGGAISVSSMPFGRKSLVEIGPDDYIYTAWTAKMNIKVYNKQGKLVKSISDQVPKVPVTKTEMEKENQELSALNLYDYSKKNSRYLARF